LAIRYAEKWLRHVKSLNRLTVKSGKPRITGLRFKSYGGQAADSADWGEQAASRNTSCDAKSWNIEMDSRQTAAKLQAGGLCSPEKLLWCERGDDFFEARLAAQGIPERH
jgi:hypothetical protein